jgi:hypothetical protein
MKKTTMKQQDLKKRDYHPAILKEKFIKQLNIKTKACLLFFNDYSSSGHLHINNIIDY